MADCEFVIIGSTVLPAVAGVVMTPAYITDSERTISGLLRVDHTAIAREWRVDLVSIPGAQVLDLLAALQSPPAPQYANIMGIETLVEVRVDALTHRPRILTGQSLSVAGDKMRADMTLTLREITPEVLGQHEVFLSSGTWDWAAAGSPATVDVLLIGGGGGSELSSVATDGGGGGGAGGFRIITGHPVSGDVAVTVGAGGTSTQIRGSVTSFGSLTAAGGGRGAREPASGASGGGSTGRNTSPITPPGAVGLSGQGHDGGAGSWGSSRRGGGGGGATGPGHNGEIVGPAGNGGAGVVLAQLGWGYADAPIAVAGGGGGGIASASNPGIGMHGGGSGGFLGNPGNNGQPNTGGGAGGPGGNGAGATGGSGLVIVRWQS